MADPLGLDLARAMEHERAQRVVYRQVEQPPAS